MVSVEVAHAKCTGCTHCRDVCPVTVFEMQPRANFGEIIDDANVAAKFQFRAEKSAVIGNSSRMFTMACPTTNESKPNRNITNMVITYWTAWMGKDAATLS